MTQRGWVDSQPHLQFTRPHQEVDKSEETCSRRQEFSGLGLPRCFAAGAQCTLPLLSSPFYLSSAPAVPTSAAEDSSVTGRLSALPHEEKSCNSSAMCRMPQGPATSSFSAWLFAVADSAHCGPLIFLAPLFVCSVNGFASNYLGGSRPGGLRAPTTIWSPLSWI